MSRPYELKRRAEDLERTRTRIVEAAIELHQTIGPAATTVTEIAQRAGVGRVTVYRHFADEAALARACSRRYLSEHPLPDPARWLQIADPAERLRTGLAHAYAYHRANEAMMSHVLADARDQPVMAPYHAHWQRAADVLVSPWRARGRRRALLRAGIALALAFDTWRALVRGQGLTDEQAIELMLRLTCEGAGAA
ncbi:MAG TPA: helix-turn-helix domain-containing protein [Gaiellaceae bacterium]|nr:helix-turn-helix domain-containing protein [Gaiellaceae bacterium]